LFEKGVKKIPERTLNLTSKIQLKDETAK